MLAQFPVCPSAQREGGWSVDLVDDLQVDQPAGPVD